jgi:PRTRC genetic system protein C
MSAFKRIFVIEGKEVEDFYPGLTPEQAKKMMVEEYSNIINASYTQTLDEEKGVLKIVFAQNTVGTRG